MCQPVLKRSCSASRGRVAAECLEANYNFHFQIYRASHSPYVVEMIEHLWLRMSPLQNKVFRASRSEQDEFLSAMPKHRQLVDALQSHDAEKATVHDRRHAPAIPALASSSRVS
jgi:DNA-binding GntR family transcriptional regulator